MIDIFVSNSDIVAKPFELGPGGWDETSCQIGEKLKTGKNTQKTRRVPTVSCTSYFIKETGMQSEYTARGRLTCSPSDKAMEMGFLPSRTAPWIPARMIHPLAARYHIPRLESYFP